MSEFQMPVGNSEKWSDLPWIVKGYIQAAFFTECNEDHPELADATFSDISEESLATILVDCALFQNKSVDYLEKACELAGKSEESLGMDFWYTRNGHGVGFWEKGRWPKYGARLDRLAKEFGECCVVRGDDGQVYFD